jgi:imidazole glycerol-phosphate synthase subunit HisH
LNAGIKSGLKKVVIIDYQLGNLFSVQQACDTIGINAKISSLPQDIELADALILPGVGAFIQAMTNLEKLSLVAPIKDSVRRQNPLFGICLGLQLLLSGSEEFGDGQGLNLVPGIVRRFPPLVSNRKIKVPQIGWNQILEVKQKWKLTPLADISDKEFMYFIHSYYAQPAEEDCILSKTNYEGIEYCSSILKDNIFATQYHPEKSGVKGLSIYKNWALINNLL